MGDRGDNLYQTSETLNTGETGKTGRKKQVTQGNRHLRPSLLVSVLSPLSHKLPKISHKSNNDIFKSQ